VKTGGPLAPLGVPDLRTPVQSLAISPDGRTLAGLQKGLFDLENTRFLELESLKSSLYWVTAPVAYSPDATIVAMILGHLNP